MPRNNENKKQLIPNLGNEGLMKAGNKTSRVDKEI
jgi:hypothetical protein